MTRTFAALLIVGAYMILAVITPGLFMAIDVLHPPTDERPWTITQLVWMVLGLTCLVSVVPVLKPSTRG